MTYQKSYKTV
uniref:Uncharacterized protein n=1 Tax=Anguilla anguilla TaxID=7936 RepID=A0A0E9V1N5_ANGAN